MNKRYNAQSNKFELLGTQSVKEIGLILAAFTLLTLGAVYVGYLIGHKPGPSVDQQVQTILDNQFQSLEQTRQHVDANMGALTQRIGLLQAHVNRLNALGDKLVSMSSIQPAEFNFMDLPAIGGPVDESHERGYGSDDINRVLELLELQLLESEQKLTALDTIMMDNKLQNAIKPQGSPILDGWMSSSYGYRNDPFSGNRQFHRGVDFAGAHESPIFAVAGGIVVSAKENAGYGNAVEIEHGNGYKTLYAHASKLLVETGDVVKKGQQIAEMGSTGRSTGPHVHFEVIRDGKHINPSIMIR